VFLVLFLPTSSRIFAALRLDEKEPKNQENLKLPCPPAGAARKIFGPTHNGSKGDCLGGQASFNGVLCLPACGKGFCNLGFTEFVVSVLGLLDC
jgi:hypothetical protein